jgi:hypothetical protein
MSIVMPVTHRVTGKRGVMKMPKPGVRYPERISADIDKEAALAAKFGAGDTGVMRLVEAYKPARRGAPFVARVYERAPGQTLESFLDNPRFDRAVHAPIITAKLNAAIRAMHRAGMAHGDLHFENVMYDPETKEVTIIDYGNARAANGDASSNLWTTQHVAAKYGISAPHTRITAAQDDLARIEAMGEVVRGENRLDAATRATGLMGDMPNRNVNDPNVYTMTRAGELLAQQIMPRRIQAPVAASQVKMQSAAVLFNDASVKAAMERDYREQQRQREEREVEQRRYEAALAETRARQAPPAVPRATGPMTTRVVQTRRAKAEADATAARARAEAAEREQKLFTESKFVKAQAEFKRQQEEKERTLRSAERRQQEDANRWSAELREQEKAQAVRNRAERKRELQELRQVTEAEMKAIMLKQLLGKKLPPTLAPRHRHSPDMPKLLRVPPARMSPMRAQQRRHSPDTPKKITHRPPRLSPMKALSRRPTPPLTAAVMRDILEQQRRHRGPPARHELVRHRLPTRKQLAVRAGLGKRKLATPTPPRQ